MTQRDFAVAVLLVSSAAFVGCSNSSPAPSGAPATPMSLPSSSIAAPSEIASRAALSTYERYWQLSEMAEAEPKARDWRPELARVMADPSLTDYVNEIANLASVPAHSVGTYRRTPKVTSVLLGEPPRVVVTDCLDATNEHLVSDKPGESGRDLDNPDQPRHYEFEAQIVRYPNPERWLVQLVQARLEKPC